MKLNKKRKIAFILVILLTCLIFRGAILNKIFTYKAEAVIPVQDLSSKYWKSLLNKAILDNDVHDINQANKVILALLSKHLQFGKISSALKPNDFVSGSITHCVGYSSLHATLLNYTIDKLKLSDCRVSHIRGQIFLLDFALTRPSNASFFRDHDFILIENTKRDQSYYSDASLYEFVKVDQIKSKMEK